MQDLKTRIAYSCLFDKDAFSRSLYAPLQVATQYGLPLVNNGQKPATLRSGFQPYE